MKELFLIIDGSAMLAAAYYGMMPPEMKQAKTEKEKEKLYGTLMRSPDGRYTNGIYGMCRGIIHLLQEAKPVYLAVAFDKNRETFRRKLYPAYKAQRKRTPAPLMDQRLLMQEILVDSGIQCLCLEGYEADDIAGSLAETYKHSTSIRLYTNDRDYLQLVDGKEDVRVWMPAPEKQAQGVYERNYGNARFMPYEELPELFRKIIQYEPSVVKRELGVWPSQIAMMKGIGGDPSDNIPGVKGVSERTAAKLLSLYGTTEKLYGALQAENERELGRQWRMNLGINRNPARLLKEQAESVRLSTLLATIRTDLRFIQTLNGFSLSKTNASQFDRWMERLAIPNTSFTEIFL